MKNIFWTLILMVGLATCAYAQNSNHIDTSFYIPVKQSNLFVRLVGNSERPIIIDLHGGPGGDSGFAHEFYRLYLEEDYLIAYLDQRGCGKSDSIVDLDLLTMEQYVEDLDVVVDTLSNIYNRNINLLGSSWGGTYGLLYLINHQEKINSFSCVSGLTDLVYAYENLIDYEEKLARDLMQKTESTDEKARYEEILVKLSEIKNSGFEEFYDNMTLIKHKFPRELGFNPYFRNLDVLEKIQSIRNDSMVFKRANYTMEEAIESARKGEIVNKAFRNTPAYNNLNTIDEIAVIEIPVMVLQGEYDYVVGLGQAQLIYNALTSVPEDVKELVIIPNISHNPVIEAPDLYFSHVKSFFDKHN